MPILHLILVAVVQGITEFLPISSSGHLVLLPNLTGLEDQGLLIDVAVHVGTLGAVILYFWSDVRRAALGVPKVLRRQVDDQNAWLALCLIVATIPVVIAGLLLKISGFDEALRSVAIVGWATLIFGLVLYWADRAPTKKLSSEWSLKDAGLMGLAQVLALIPGTSRSGITITAARKLGYAREDAARLAMLMSIPTILASGALLGFEALFAMDAAAARDAGIAAVFAFLAAFAALALMMRLLRSVSFTPYVIYRVGLGLILLWIAYT
ncbi:MAG: undecaprenyl-diphosphate phosphatase [Boseongicola sp.]|nr:undecaprenyl-diphosphate phosphatase [Boseongicola sp.]MDD9976469.1 undecaprenyl-diphosphate phosphatase [Boseongicola sp.]